MKQMFLKICVILAISIIVNSIAVFPVTATVVSSVQDITRSFIEKVLSIDLTKYRIILAEHSTLEGIPIAGVNGQPIDIITDNVCYTLDSEESTLRINFRVQDCVIVSCHIYVEKGQFINDKQYTDLTDAMRSFLEKYQAFTKMDSTDMIVMLDKVDANKNLTLTSGNTKFVISNINKYGIKQTSFKWTYIVNNVDYTSLEVSFRDGNIYSIHDDRAIYTIGDTAINISREQAIAIAMNYLTSYSYKMPNNVTVSNFNINGELTTAELATSPIHSTELRPYWNVKLYLNQTYPGSVKGFSIYIWANSGEPFSCTKIAIGGVEQNNSDIIMPQEGNDSPSKNNLSTKDTSLVSGIAIAVISLTIALIVYKRKKATKVNS